MKPHGDPTHLRPLSKEKPVENSGTANKQPDQGGKHDASFPFDVFISHAVEDKYDFTEAFVTELERHGLKVWYSSEQLGPGSKISYEVDKAISQSAYCIAVVSPAYLDHKWTMDEYRAFYAKETACHSIIIPIWHRTTYEEVKEKSPLMADRFAISSEKPMKEIIEKILAFMEQNSPESEKRNPPSFFRQFVNIKLEYRIGLIGILLGIIAGGGLFINSSKTDISTKGKNSPIYVNPGGEERYQSAWLSIDEEMKTLFSAMTALLSQIDNDVPESFYDVPKPGELGTAFQMRARDNFRQYEENIQMYRREWAFDNTHHQSQRLNLEHHPIEMQNIDAIYVHFQKIERIISDYQDQLISLQRLEHLMDGERVERAKDLHRIKLVEAKMELVDAARKYCHLPDGNRYYPEEQFRVLQLQLPLPEGNIQEHDWKEIIGYLYQQKSEGLARQVSKVSTARGREIDRIISDPYLLFLRRMMGLSDTLSEGEVLALKNKVLDDTITDPAKLFELAAFSFLECDGWASAYYYRRAIKTATLSSSLERFAQFSIDRLEHPETYQGSLGVMVVTVDKNGNLDQAGISMGDVITACEGQVVHEALDLSNLLAKADKDQIVLDVIRAGQAKRFAVSGRQAFGAQLTQLVVLQIVHI
ncbi:MAG: TIR domain-containing protein [Bacteroidota bacterium]